MVLSPSCLLQTETCKYCNLLLRHYDKNEDYSSGRKSESAWIFQYAGGSLYPTPLVVVGTMVNGKPNYVLVGHVGIIGHDRIIVSLAKSHYTNQEMKETRSLTVNIVDEAMLKISRCQPTNISVQGMAKAVDLCLTKEEIDYLEEPYVLYALVGVMA